jgi:hypothetical protein
MATRDRSPSDISINDRSVHGGPRPGDPDPTASRARGRRFALGPDRSLVLDLLVASHRVPRFAVERWFDLTELAEARQQAAARISWVVLFAKAYALVARQIAPLRWSFQRWPRASAYESPHSAATIAISREHRGVERLFWGTIMQPESKNLSELQAALSRYQTAPVEDVFAKQLRLSRWPRIVRRLGWAWRLNFAPRQRVRRFGTFGMSILAGQRAYNRSHPSFLTSSLTYGPIEPDGRMLVTLICDHRVIDGLTVARALEALEQTLQQTMLAELRGLPQSVTTRDA